MSHFGWVVHKVVEQSDIILEILDARFIEETRNKEVEEKINQKKKILIYVINKCDLVDDNHIKKIRKELGNCVFISAKKYYGIKMLKDKLTIMKKQHKLHDPVIGVIGYPNVGKSSIINALSGRGSARTSAEAGFTKGKQLLRVNNHILMLDTPGVISKKKQEESDLVLLGAKNPYSVEDPDVAVFSLLRHYPGLIPEFYKVPDSKSKEKIIESIAIKNNMKKKGNLPDMQRASRKILQDWQNGKIKR